MTFKPPTMQEAKKYADSISFKTFNPVTWWHHYESNGWMVGKNKMKSWRSAVWTWFTPTYEWREIQRKKKATEKKIRDQREQWGGFIQIGTEIKLKELRKAPEWEYLWWLIDELRPEIKGK